MRELFEPRPHGALRRVAERLRAALPFARGHGEAKPRDERRRIAGWAIAIGLVAGLIDLALPAEDAFRAVRAAVRMHAADQSVLVVTVDDRSLNALGANEPPRSVDARFLDRLFALGAERVFFDRAYADPTSPSEDRKFAQALARHRGKVYLGGTPLIDQSDGGVSAIVPHARFRPSAQIVSIYGEESPFGLSTRLPTSSLILGQERPSLSAELAGIEHRGGSYRPDFAIDYKTIPTVSYIDVLTGAAGEAAIRGKDVVVSPSSRTATDYHPIPLRGKVPGVYFHVIGAETLKHGYPLNLGWLPAFVLACAVVAAQARRPRPSKRLLALGGAALTLVPLALDTYSVVVDVMPALICLAIASVRLHVLARKTYRGSTGLQRIETMLVSRTAEEMDVLALKIRNFATISATLSPPEIDQLLVKALAMLRATDPRAQFAFQKDTFVWSRSKMTRADREDHVRGLHALFRTSIAVGSKAPDIASSIGIDINYDASLRERAENAMQCAEDAAHAGKIFLVSEPRMAEDLAWRIRILSELDSAIRNDEVDVAFQPKVSLATGAIVGAEALLRWTHPIRGPIEPSQVIAIAEEHDRVDMITRFVLNRALGQARKAIDRHPQFKIAINISALDLRDRMFLSHVEQIVAAHRVPAANVVLEVTETAPIENDETIAAVFAGLKRMGIKLSVDDFGTGHASLEHLRRIPADEVKIDRSFVAGMDASDDDRALVRTAIEMIHSLGRTAVAEGVESGAVAELLREMGCDEAQGYYFSRPITMNALLPQLPPGAVAA